MATSEQRPPVNNDQTKSGQANFDTNFDWETSSERPAMYNGHFLAVPRVAVVDRFDCTYKPNFMQIMQIMQIPAIYMYGMT